MQDFEVKYTASNAKATAIRAWLEDRLPPDGDYPEAIITSIYFDTKNLKLLGEKINSDHIKSKFRIRWYQDIITNIPSEMCFLEFKHKIGFQRLKKRIKQDNIYHNLPLESEVFYSCFLQMRHYEGNILEHIFPSYAISYTRKRFCIPNTDQRVCIDYNINVSKTNSLLIHKNAKNNYLSKCVFETKGPLQDQPEVCQFLEKFGLQKEAFSKYERCYKELLT